MLPSSALLLLSPQTTVESLNLDGLVSSKQEDCGHCLEDGQVGCWHLSPYFLPIGVLEKSVRQLSGNWKKDCLLLTVAKTKGVSDLVLSGLWTVGRVELREGGLGCHRVDSSADALLGQGAGAEPVPPCPRPAQGCVCMDKSKVNRPVNKGLLEMVGMLRRCCCQPRVAGMWFEEIIRIINTK